jgi:hypothetical protein
MPNCPDRTNYAKNLKGMLMMFMNDLNQSLGIVEPIEPPSLE